MSPRATRRQEKDGLMGGEKFTEIIGYKRREGMKMGGARKGIWKRDKMKECRKTGIETKDFNVDKKKHLIQSRNRGSKGKNRKRWKAWK